MPFPIQICVPSHYYQRSEPVRHPALQKIHSSNVISPVYGRAHNLFMVKLVYTSRGSTMHLYIRAYIINDEIVRNIDWNCGSADCTDESHERERHKQCGLGIIFVNGIPPCKHAWVWDVRLVIWNALQWRIGAVGALSSSCAFYVASIILQVLCVEAINCSWTASVCECTHTQ